MFTVITLLTVTLVSPVDSPAYPSVLTRRILTEVYFHFTVTTHEPQLAIAMVIVHQLHAVQSSERKTRTREALVDVALAPGTYKAGRAHAVEPSDFVDTSAVVVTGIFTAIIGVNFTYVTQRTGRARTQEIIYQIVTRATVLTRVWFAIVHVQFAVLALEAFRALA